jgi:hypothetical protein
VLLEGDRLQLRVRRSGATINEVEVHGTTALHPGDVLTEDDLQYLVLPAESGNSVQGGSKLLDHWGWLRRVEEEVSAAQSSFAILIGRSGAFESEDVPAVLSGLPKALGIRHVVGRCVRSTVEVLALGDAPHIDAFQQLVSERAGKDDETVRWGVAWFPAHGGTAEELWAAAMGRLLGHESPRAGDLVWSDPCMTRLRALADRWSRRPQLILIGSEGVGRESLARHIRVTGAQGAPFVVHRAARFDRARWAEDVARAAGGALHVRRPEVLPEDELNAFWSARAFLPSLGLSTLTPSSLPGDRLVIPELVHRSADIAPIAEVTLHAVDVQLGRRRSSLRIETRQALQRLLSSENVRTLRNVVIRGALNATGTEVRPEHLDITSAEPASFGVRAKVQETERREIEAALQRSGWNVTEAARRMQLPRRTLVYRMSRLGLTRPGGPG